MTDATESYAEDAQHLVPEHWPAERTDVPVGVWFVHGLLALPGMILLWFLPKTAGVRLAAAGWKSALTAHVLGVTIGAGLIVWAQAFSNFNPAGAPPRNFWIVTVNPPTPHMPLHEYLTAPFAALAIGVHGASAAGGWGIEHGMAAVALLETGMVILALILMPYAAAGERTSLLFGRCLLLTWWSTTLLIPLGIGFMLDPIVRRWLDLPNKWVASDDGRLALFGIWWLLVWLRSGSRYAGLPDGPAWQPRTPFCEGCGYAIVGIPITTKCPECGRPVRDSLPQRRGLPPFKDQFLGVRRIRALLATCWTATSDKTFFDRLAVHRGHEDARSFFFALCEINAVIALSVAANYYYERKGGDDSLWYGVIFACLFMVSEVVLSGLAALLIASIGRIGIQPAAIISFYGLTSLFHVSCAGLVLVFIAMPLAELFGGHNLGANGSWVGPFLWMSLGCILFWLVLAGVAVILSLGIQCIVRALSKSLRAQG